MRQRSFYPKPFKAQVVQECLQPGVSGRWSCANRQQAGREPDTAMGTQAFELVVCQVTAQWQTGGGDHEPDPVGAREWGMIRMPISRCADAAADTAGQ
jgi:hypothetical protein